MAKRRTPNTDDYFDEYTDDPIGLTGAFATAHDPQAVEYDKGDKAIGLTEAFATVDSPEPHAWDEAGKWKDFDWDAGAGDEAGGAPTSEAGLSGLDASAVSEDRADEANRDFSESSAEMPVASSGFTGGAYNDDAREINVAKDLAHASAVAASGKAARRGKHAAQAPEVSQRMQQSRKMRRTLTVVIVLLVLGLCALGFFVFRTVSTGQEEADQQAQEQIEATKDTETETEGDDTVETAVEQADVPNLVSLLGHTQDEAIAQVGRGALVSNTQKVKDKKSAIKTNVTIALADEPADSKTGAPNVYLGLDKKGKIIQVGYSASASALGFGSLSFADAVNSEHVIERTLGKIGVEVEEGVATLPADSGEYVTYADDGTTVTKERASFDGDVSVDGAACEWSAVLSYDYSTQIITGNLSDTVRIIYVYVSRK